MADAVGIILEEHGFNVVDQESTSRVMGILNLNEIEISRGGGLGELKNQGIDALLTVKTVGGV